jgi:site-specific DNA recombinase
MTPHRADLATEPAATRRGVLYLRVSSRGQVNTDYDPEGISINAQRQICAAKAASLGIEIVGDYAELGLTATSMDKRPEFQKMLARIRNERDVDCVIVYKLSRMNRNRIEDALVMEQLRKYDVSIVSATEGIDATRNGQLLHGILASINEFRSAEDGADIRDKLSYKARNGGTIGLAPLGYVNTKEIFEGRRINTVAIDEERASFVVRAFELYATGEYSVKTLHRQLTAEGLTTRPTPKRPSAPIAASKLASLLRNRYYIGVIVHRGLEYDGRHPALVPTALFDRVQAILDERDQTSTKHRVHQHYLRGLLNCARCGSRLIYMRVRSKGGSQIAYYACGKRHRDQTCDLPYFQADVLERRIESGWPQWVRLDAVDSEEVGEKLHANITSDDRYNLSSIRRTSQSLARLDKERLKLVEMAYADAIPMDLLRTEQDRIKRERAAAEKELAEAATSGVEIEAVFQMAASLMQRGAAIYAASDDETRRQLNRAFLERIKVDIDREEVVLESPWREIDTAARYFRALNASPPPKPRHQRARPRVGTPAANRKTKNPERAFAVQGSNMNLLVELRGLEPLTPTLPALTERVRQERDLALNTAHRPIL